MKGMKKYNVKLTGLDTMLWNRDNFRFDAEVSKWQKGPSGRDCPRGDDRFPAWKWIGKIYHDATEKSFALCCDEVISAVLSEAGKGITMSGKKTYKEPAKTAIEYINDYAEIKLRGKPIPFSPFKKLFTGDVTDMDEHTEIAQKHGIDIDIRRVSMGGSKHVRCRPLIPVGWTAEFSMSVDDEIIDKNTLKQLFHIAGTRKGIGDWRPGSPKSPGKHGRFNAEIKEMK